ncbi:MAG: adenosine deaminase [Pseudomonadota bacterium]
MHAFVAGLPKVELHVHLEGTLEPEQLFEFARRNGVTLPFETPEAVVAAYDFHDLPSFLTIYYKGMEVLHSEQDFYDLTMAYLEKAAAHNVRYVEPFFDPQPHTNRGVAFDTVINGIHRALQDGASKLGVHSQLILCFLRDLSAESAEAHLDFALQHKDKIVGIGLDSDEAGNPPRKFAAVFERARREGFKLTMHCDVNQQDTHANIRECLDLIKVDRIDHGVNSLEVDDLMNDIRDRGLGLTVCPISNRFCVQDLTGNQIRQMLEHGMKATINSDDPAYFRGYMNENFQALADEHGFTEAELGQLSRNAIEVCWAPNSLKQTMTAELDRYLTGATG